jgi:hypothetical protein
LFGSALGSSILVTGPSSDRRPAPSGSPRAAVPACGGWGSLDGRGKALVKGGWIAQGCCRIAPVSEICLLRAPREVARCTAVRPQLACDRVGLTLLLRPCVTPPAQWVHHAPSPPHPRIAAVNAGGPAALGRMSPRGPRGSEPEAAIAINATTTMLVSYTGQRQARPLLVSLVRIGRWPRARSAQG